MDRLTDTFFIRLVLRRTKPSILVEFQQTAQTRLLEQGYCRKNCNYDYISRLAFRIFTKLFIHISSVNVLYSVTTYVKRFFPVIHYF